MNDDKEILLRGCSSSTYEEHGSFVQFVCLSERRKQDEAYNRQSPKLSGYDPVYVRISCWKVDGEGDAVVGV